VEQSTKFSLVWKSTPKISKS